ncbi:MAG: hypothetical protein N2C14_11000 [Planctomycetales bacterium]
MVSAPVPAGAQCAEADGLHEILFYRTPVELVGGGMATPSFSVDLDTLRDVLAFPDQAEIPASPCSAIALPTSRC